MASMGYLARHMASVAGTLAAATALAACGGPGGASGQSGVAAVHRGPGAGGTSGAGGTGSAASTPVTASPGTGASATTAPSSGTGPGASTPPAGSSGGGPVLIVHNADGAVTFDGERPGTIDFSVDSSNIVTHLTWSAWGPTGATGTGTLMANNCRPNCAQGTVTPVPTTVTLSGVSHGHFTALTERSASGTRHYHYPSYWASGAS
ncbi:MAG: hypothetical protein M0032_01125 [Actinomycetota bacterium]|nr:hypothetical protein [Actinomycetota bacterium]MDA8268716.1 hypothetical protein [Actinomycetota bacterium]